jgi:hypothetical protein
VQVCFVLSTFTFAVLKIHSFLLTNIPTPALPAPHAFKRLIFTPVGRPRLREKSANSLAVKAQNRFSMGMFHQVPFKISFKLFGVHCLDLCFNSVGEHPDCFT